MSRISCKTPGGVSPQGRGRVWFCACAEDYPIYFDAISNELLAAARCAVYYDTTPEQPFAEGELAEALSEINLFVVPITTRFLSTENRARCVELGYALAHHIPILPLMQENGLESDFNRLCGDLQLLNKNDTDVTAIPYAEKLSRFLSSVLVGDEQAAEVRRAFDAYVFLSYRKKDRRYAQELMRLIHRHDFCRDVAIWYDEFLTPGENFNDAIAGALDKCDLFALAVTPNLVNEENYVKTTEYPAARSAGKRILAAELIPTDRGALQRDYEGIPDPVDPRGDALPTALRAALSHIVVRRDENDARHNFLIGLAYLSGIDVEVDRERAVSLIHSAAEAGLAKAMGKLVSMYRAGEGVPRDYRTATEWQHRLVGRLYLLFKEKPTTESARRVINESGELFDMLYELRRYKDAVESQQELLQFLEGEHTFPSVDAARAQAYRRIGNIALAEGKLLLAERQYRLSLSCTEKIPDAQTSRAARINYIQIYIKLGDLARERRELVAAKEYYEKALALLNPDDERRSLSILHGRLGTTALRLGDHEGAQKHYEAALQLDRIAYEETPNLQAKRDLSISYDRLGSLARTRLRLKAARELFTHSLAYDREIYEESGTAGAKRAVALSLMRMGTVCFDLGDYDDAARHFEESLVLRRELYTEANTYESKRDLVSNCSWLGRLAVRREEWAKAEAYFKEELELNLEIANEAPIPEIMRDIAISCHRYANLAKNRKRYKEALVFLEAARRIDQILLELSRTVEAMRDMSTTFDALFTLCWQMGEYARAKEYALQETALDREILAISGTPGARSDLSTSCTRLGDLNEHFGDYIAAEENYAEAVDLALTTYIDSPNIRTCGALSNALFDRAVNAERIHYYEVALASYRRCYALQLEIFNEKPGHDRLGEAVRCLMRVGRVLLAMQENAKARMIYEKAQEHCKEMQNFDDSVTARSLLAEALERTAHATLRCGDRAAARALYISARDLLLPLSAENPDRHVLARLLSIVKSELADLKDV